MQTWISSLDPPGFRRLPRTRSGVRRNDEKEQYPYYIRLSGESRSPVQGFQKEESSSDDVYTIMDSSVTDVGSHESFPPFLA